MNIFIARLLAHIYCGFHWKWKVFHNKDGAGVMCLGAEPSTFSAITFEGEKVSYKYYFRISDKNWKFFKAR